jgi:hypothetical protein
MPDPKARDRRVIGDLVGGDNADGNVVAAATLVPRDERSPIA